MTELLGMLANLTATGVKFMQSLGGVLTFLTGALTFLLKANELWEKIRQFSSSKGKNKGSTKRNSRKNP